MFHPAITRIGGVTAHVTTPADDRFTLFRPIQKTAGGSTTTSICAVAKLTVSPKFATTGETIGPTRAVKGATKTSRATAIRGEGIQTTDELTGQSFNLEKE
jgi:hypothetical protein